MVLMIISCLSRKDNDFIFYQYYEALGIILFIFYQMSIIFEILTLRLIL